MEHWPNVVSLAMDNAEQLDRFKEPCYCWDARANATYYISKVDPKMYLVIIFYKQRKKDDRIVQEFVYLIATHLRNWSIFAKLSPRD